MNPDEWIFEMPSDDGIRAMKDESPEPIYTIYKNDFLQIPKVNFQELVLIDDDLRVMLN